ncbi:MAG: phosphoribosylformylglycinamidine cyclo-ligase [Actinomycetota bacterium]|jgi:phosphoribosylformylglycinamidine cyclo-ligase|nr:phosphoribosylformylglycinamidine cyclo-ligase [Actinomycetota bacterium]
MTDENGKRPITYRDAGVDTGEGTRAVNGIRESVRSTYRPEVIGDIGGFGGMFSAAAFKDMDDPIMVSGTDGVGTKLKLAQLLGRHDSVGIDLVAMCVNDILVAGAEPLFFLDYVAIGKLDSALVESLVSGIAEGCRQAGCSLVGGEMAEHPGVMADDDYDLSGFCVGVVDRPRMIDHSNVSNGDVILGLGSSGIHSNGYSLVRKVLVEGREDELALPRIDLGGVTLGDALLTPTRIYVKSILELLRAEIPVKAMAHITGGGISENLNRVLPAECSGRVALGSWKVPPIFDLLAAEASLSDDEMYRTFNMGIGYMVIVDPKDAPRAAVVLRGAGESVSEIGEIVKGDGSVVYG